MHSFRLARLRQLAACVLLATATVSVAPADTARLQAALERAGENRAQLESALDSVAESRRPGMQFLIENMPDSDLQSLPSGLLVENVEYAYQAWEESPWRAQVDQELFFNSVLPYASVSERREAWRKDFFERFKPMVAGVDSPGEAAAKLNNEIFPLLKVAYNTGRKRPDQGPYETIDSGKATCTGLSIVLIDACRAVGIPARFVGTPLWSDNSGNHSWVEVWDGEWKFTGAAEPTGMDLNKGWFVGRAARAERDDKRYAIYATSFRRTPLSFPMVWNLNDQSVPAVNVTDRYTSSASATPDGHAEARFRVVDSQTGRRTQCSIAVTDAGGQTLFEGLSKDERFDTNDHLLAALPKGATYKVVVDTDGRQTEHSFVLDRDEQLVTVRLDESDPIDPVAALQEYLTAHVGQRAALAEQGFAAQPLSREQAEEASELLWDDHRAAVRATRAEEMEAKVITLGDREMPFDYKVFGDKPSKGRSLYISMHGGGGAPARVNTRQWENQKRLYEPDEGVYLAPRAPTDTWDLWHQAHVDKMFARLIENLIVFEDVDPDRVYVMGYSAGGDGVYQLAPRMADRWAAAAMMAGHPNDASPLSLRNIGFSLYMGGKDAAYKRNEVAAEWRDKLAKLKTNDPGGYEHLVTIYPEKGHWMDREDASALPWMAAFTRNPLPEKIVWRQDDVTHPRFYWLAAGDESPAPEAIVTAVRDGQRIDVESEDVDSITILLNDAMLDLDKPVRVTSGDRVLFEGSVERSIADLDRTLRQRGDPGGAFSAKVTVRLTD